MAVNYRYEWRNNKGKIIEQPTNQVILITKSRKQTINTTNWLNSGAAFAGFTPQFFLVKVNVREH